MTGPKYSVIGMDIEASLKRFETSLPEPSVKVSSDAIFCNSLAFEIEKGEVTLPVSGTNNVFVTGVPPTSLIIKSWGIFTEQTASIPISFFPLAFIIEPEGVWMVSIPLVLAILTITFILFYNFL